MKMLPNLKISSINLEIMTLPEENFSRIFIFEYSHIFMKNAKHITIDSNQLYTIILLLFTIFINIIYISQSNRNSVLLTIEQELVFSTIVIEQIGRYRFKQNETSRAKISTISNCLTITVQCTRNCFKRKSRRYRRGH